MTAAGRKDLSLFGCSASAAWAIRFPSWRLAAGHPRLGRDYTVAVIGAGRVGQALAQYGGFASRGFRVRWVYDADPGKVGLAWDGLRVRDVRQITTDFRESGPDIAIVATPADVAQAVAAQLVDLGVKAILNFAPVHLAVPDDVVVKNVNMAIELETLSYALRHR
jgi:redox-sensing transcriptional repressor